jgi:hypothetical protein
VVGFCGYGNERSGFINLLKFLTSLSTIGFSKGQFFTCDNHRAVVWLMLHISAAHLPVCVTYLQLAACESGTGHR